MQTLSPKSRRLLVTVSDEPDKGRRIGSEYLHHLASIALTNSSHSKATMGSRQCDVLIVGAGPVGLLLALLLKQNGVDVIVVERQKALYPLPRAVLLDHESRRLFGLAGLSGEIDAILEDVIGEGGEEGINFVWRDADLKREADDRYEHSTEQLRTVIVDLHTEKPTRSGHPFISGFTQPAVEGLLEKTLLDRKIPLIRGYGEEIVHLVATVPSTDCSTSTALRTLDQYPDRVDAEFTEATSKDTRCVENGSYRPAQTTEGRKTNGHHTNGTTDPGLHVRASYVVGCDGANSTVRRMQNLSITDLNFESDWLIIDLVCIISRCL